MADGQVKNYYLITISGSNENVVIPDSWIRARVGGAILASLPLQNHKELAPKGGPFCFSWSLKYAQIQRGFDHYSEASNYLNKSKVLNNSAATQKSPEIRNSQRGTIAQINVNSNRSELEALLRNNIHLQSNIKNNSPPETSLKNSSRLETSLKEGSQSETLLKKSPPKTYSNPSLSKESTNTNDYILFFNQVVDSTVLAQLRTDSACNSEQQKKNVPGLVPIKSLQYSANRKAVNPGQIARVTPLETPSFKASPIVLNKTANTKAEAGLKDNSSVAPSCETNEGNKAVEQEAQRPDIHNNMPLKSKKELPQIMTTVTTTVIDDTNELHGQTTEFLDWMESLEAAKEYLMNMHSSLNQNCKHSTLTNISLKTNLSIFKMKVKPTTVVRKCNIASLEQLCEPPLKQSDEERKQECNELMSTTESSASAGTSDVMAICSTTPIQNRDIYSRNKKTRLNLILQKLEDSVTIFENIKMTRDNLSASLKDILRTTTKTRKLIHKSLKMTTPTFKRRVRKEIKPSLSIETVNRIKKIVKYRTNNMDLEDKWTLKYKEQKRGTVELMENSYIYVNKKGLAKCKKYAKDYRHLGRLLLHEVFTQHALHKCSMIISKKRMRPESYRRPGLNKAGLKTLCDFVETYRPTKKDSTLYMNWRPVDRKALRISISKYLYNCRKY